MHLSITNHIFPVNLEGVVADPLLDDVESGVQQIHLSQVGSKE